MNIKTNWHAIRAHFRLSFRTNFHVSIASVGEDGNPTATPIGSLFLNNDQSGFYFEKYPTKLPAHAKLNKNICVLAVNSGMSFWLRSLLLNKFQTHPGIKLYGQLGEHRKATEDEIRRLNRRMHATKSLKGNAYLWKKCLMCRRLNLPEQKKLT